MADALTKLPRPIVAVDFPFEDTGWLGGVYAIAHLLHAHAKLPDPRLKLVLVAPPSLPDRVLEAVPNVEIWHTKLLGRSSLRHRLRRLVRKLSGRDFLMEHWLRRRRVSVYSHGEPLGHGATIAVLGHIADLGVNHYPEWYPNAESKQRYCRRVADDVDRLLLISHAVDRDFDHFYGSTKARRSVVHIVPEVPGIDLVAEGEVQRRYDLGGRYFFLPNKFWVHKNHRVVVEALGLLASRGVELTVACCGMTADERDPQHFGDLMTRVAELGISKQFRVLGILPSHDVAMLMRGAVAILNPSRFEGWGLSVAEAREMGKQIVLADIPVFREHALDHARFFDADDAEALAAIMEQLWGTHDPITDRAHQELAAATHADRQIAYARQYEDLVLSMIGDRPGMAS